MYKGVYGITLSIILFNAMVICHAWIKSMHPESIINIKIRTWLCIRAYITLSIILFNAMVICHAWIMSMQCKIKHLYFYENLKIFLDDRSMQTNILMVNAYN